MYSMFPCFHGGWNIKAYRIQGVNVHNTYQATKGMTNWKRGRMKILKIVVESKDCYEEANSNL